MHYVICSTPRSGSGLLARGMASTGLAGAPAEYFNENQRIPLAERWEAGPTVVGYVLALRRHRTSAGGVLGVKLHRDQLTTITAEHEGEPADAAASARALRALFGDLRLVHITRRELDRQAVSFFRAMGTGVWSVRPGDAPKPSAPEPAYDFAELARLRAWLQAEDEAWEAVFTALGTEPSRVVYEDFVDDHEPTVRRVLTDVLGPFDDGARIAPADGVRQADAWTEAILARFTADRERATPA